MLFFGQRANGEEKKNERRVSRASDVRASGGELEAAAAAKLMRFTSGDGHHDSRLPGTHKSTANTSERRLEMLSTLFYSPLRKLILLIDCCPWLPTPSQGEQIEMYCGVAGGERGSLAWLFCQHATTTTTTKKGWLSYKWVYSVMYLQVCWFIAFPRALLCLPTFKMLKAQCAILSSI